MADLIHGNTQTGATKQDLIAAAVQKELAFQAMLLSLVTDVSKFAVKGAKSISFPKLSNFTATNRSSGAAGDASVVVSSVDKLDLDQSPYLAWIVDSNDEIQSTLEWQLELAIKAANAQGRFVDTHIISKLEAHGDAITATGDITRDIVLDMRGQLISQYADKNALALVVSVDQEKAMLKIDEFTRAEVYGSAVIPSGMIGKVYGVPVYVHNGLAASTYYMFEKSGLAVGFQKAPSMSEQSANEYGTGAKRTAMDQLFGAKGMQLNAGVSALIVKDNN